MLVDKPGEQVCVAELVKVVADAERSVEGDWRYTLLYRYSRRYRRFVAGSAARREHLVKLRDTEYDGHIFAVLLTVALPGIRKCP